jgi:hypothetical protein
MPVATTVANLIRGPVSLLRSRYLALLAVARSSGLGAPLTAKVPGWQSSSSARVIESLDGAGGGRQLRGGLHFGWITAARGC